jgi:hypothetical protein
MTVSRRQAINARTARGTKEHQTMITCYLRYEVPLGKLAEFEAYGRMWIELVPRFGGIHHGYFLPSEGASDVQLPEPCSL